METPINPWMIWVEKPPFSETPNNPIFTGNPPSMPPSPSTGSPRRADQAVPGGVLSRHGGRDLWGRTVYLPTCFVVDFQIVKVGIYTVRPIDPMG